MEVTQNTVCFQTVFFLCLILFLVFLPAGVDKDVGGIVLRRNGGGAAVNRVGAGSVKTQYPAGAAAPGFCVIAVGGIIVECAGWAS